MDINEVREKYLIFFKERGHGVVESASLVPLNDPTTLFTGSGMQPMVPYLLGEKHPLGTRVVDSQKCFRAEDIEEVGDNRHTTFFEMLGNWSFGDYYKKEQLRWYFEFLTKEVGLDPSKLYVTCFLGDSEFGFSRDNESMEAWKELFSEVGIEAKEIEIGSEEDGYTKGMQGGRIFFYDASKNWWSRAGAPAKMPVGEPGGPDSEVFYDFGLEHDESFGEHCHVNCDCGRFVELGNSVFMEYLKKSETEFVSLEEKNVDHGSGLMRIAAAAVDNPDVFAIGVLKEIIEMIEEMVSVDFSSASKEEDKSFRVVADHIHGAVFLLADGVLPSNTEQGYMLRRLIRRAVRFADKLGVKEGGLSSLASVVISYYGEHYGDLVENKKRIIEEIDKEEEKFRKTLLLGLREFEKGERDAFLLFTSYGFPVEMVGELAEENGERIDMVLFEKKMVEHREKSRAGALQKFKGGLADHSEMVVRLHTAHHLLLAALQKVVSSDIKQRGSNITGERLRIDFNFDRKLSLEEREKVEDLVNEWIDRDLSVVRREMSREEAMGIGAQMEFGAKYPDVVSVYFIEDEKGDVISKEFCGGPHVERLGELGKLKIKKEESSSAGVRRIKAVLI